MAQLETQKIKNADGSVISLAALKKMSWSQIRELEPVMRGARIEEFYDTAVIEPDGTNGIVAAGDKITLFRKGMNQDDTYFSQGGVATGKYNKVPYLDTNMNKDGEFETGQAFLIQEIETVVCATANVKSGGVAANGTPNSPVITSTGTNYDPAVLMQMVLNQFYLRFKRNTNVQHEGLLREFPTRYGMSGAYGASIGGFVQNTSFGGDTNRLAEPEIISGNQDFSVELEYLGELFDTSVVNQWLRIQVILRGLFIYEIHS
jgi:hypothetical protein